MTVKIKEELFASHRSSFKIWWFIQGMEVLKTSQYFKIAAEYNSKLWLICQKRL